MTSTNRHVRPRIRGGVGRAGSLMAITDITDPKGIYFFKGYLAKVVLESNVITFCDLFLALMHTEI